MTLRMNINIKKILTTVLLVLFAVWFSLGNDPKPATAAELYRDGNGYFALIPPDGWSQQDYPEETIRSKVAFHNQKNNDVNIRIISGPTPTTRYSLDDMYDENKQKINNIFKRKWPKGTYTIKRGKVGERMAIIQKNIIPRMMAQEVRMMINNGVWYSIACNATTKADLERSMTNCKKLVNSFVILDSKKKFSEKEIMTSLVASKKRLAELFEEAGDIQSAVMYIEAGLSIDPDNKDLKAIKKRLRSK